MNKIIKYSRGVFALVLLLLLVFCEEALAQGEVRILSGDEMSWSADVERILQEESFQSFLSRVNKAVVCSELSVTSAEGGSTSGCNGVDDRTPYVGVAGIGRNVFYDDQANKEIRRGTAFLLSNGMMVSAGHV